MNISGRSFLDHVVLILPLFGLIVAVWLLRMELAMAGAPHWLVHLFSVTTTVSISVILTAFLIYLKRFGSYANLVLCTILLVSFAELLIVLSILFSVLSGIETVYSAPEFSIPGDSPLQIRHIVGHLTFGIGSGTLTGSAMGCLFLFLLRALGKRGGEEEP